MPDNIEKILEDFDSKAPLFKELDNCVCSIINSLLKPVVRTHQITSRIKDRVSLSTKLARDNKYEELDSVTDILGVRVILYFEDDIDKVADVITSEFNIDEKNSIDKRILAEDKFGYRSLHYIASLNSVRGGLRENTKIRNLKFEIQVRSILQHSWAEIEHDLGYKSDLPLPNEYKRAFNRIAALLELADSEFSKIREDLVNYQSQKLETSELTYQTLSAYMAESKTIKDLEPLMRLSGVNKKEPLNLSHAEAYTNGLRNLNITTIDQLDRSIKQNIETLIKFANVNVENLIKNGDFKNGIFFTRDIVLAFLIHILRSDNALFPNLKK